MDKPLKEITVDDIRLLPRYESLSEDELHQLVESIKEFAVIISNYVLDKNSGKKVSNISDYLLEKYHENK